MLEPYSDNYLIKIKEDVMAVKPESIIIGIHGLAKKPSKATLSKWWKDAICEGLSHNISKYKKNGISPSQLNFSMVYWNNLMGKKKDRILTIPQLKENKDHYQPARDGDIEAHNPSPFGKHLIKARIEFLDLVEDITEVIMGLTHKKVSRTVMRRKLKDLDRYYDNKNLSKTLQDHLINELKDHSEKRIMLISHSMGTIIAYDALSRLAEDRNKLVIDHFITMGSPLGLPFITKQIPQKKRGKPAVPDNIKKWTNFADQRDPVCADLHLSDDYRESSEGVGIIDQLVDNDWDHDHLYHKSYGYLRTPEASKAIAKFLR